MNKQRGVFGLAIALALGGAAQADFGDPVIGLTAEELQRFTDGQAAFASVEEADEGLGPIFNGTSCGGCHSVGALGGGSDTVETRFGTTTGGAFDPLASLGGSLIQNQGIGAAGACTFVGEVVPPQATIRAGRRTTPLFGLGLVDAVPDATFVALARTQARRTPATAGRANMVVNVVSGGTSVGKFGWKAQVPSLIQFSGDAYVNEMGITTPMFPDEMCPNGDCSLLACDPVPGIDDDLEDVEAFNAFMSFLAPPPRLGPVDFALASAQLQQTFPGTSSSALARGGSRVFGRIGCDDCHAPALTSGPSPVAALNRRRFRPYSDFLLHDMGSLGDGIEQGTASGREMRTAPLWGLHVITTFLHDGRAKTIEEAILAHDGQGAPARGRFLALRPIQRASLLAFLGTL
ncbi:MAG TPA: di-heme oxidoredictase family protein [Candidatus Eisenbacteria bacterium]|nr:di-heme oxidoredictase family protein [Candidatus Eisenbacteria bacterium]